MIFSARRLRTFVLAQCLALLAGIPTFALASPACASYISGVILPVMGGPRG